MCKAIAILALLLVTTAVNARPHRGGANHHLGDDSWIARFGRAPTADDSEPLRMRVHLAYVRDLLAAAPATSPALAGRRAELLGYLDDYIAKGTVPINRYVSGRNPVFIDATGTICAVGYLIERSAGRTLPEAIARTHRVDYLEDIAAAMPEVASWVAGSGFTLDELASIQPGYPGPEVMHEVGWLVASAKETDDWQASIGEALPDDGAYSRDGLTGTFRRGQMVGTWTRTLEGRIIGRGEFTRGRGTWTSFRLDGTRLAEGAFVNSHAHGTWKIWHPSGRLAATGPMKRGARHGAWTFFYDSDAHGKLAVGAFGNGQTLGGWKHFDERGKLVATVDGSAWDSLTIRIAANAAGVRHDVHQGIPAEGYRMDGLYLGDEKLYIDRDGTMWNGDAQRVEKTDAGWVTHACTWPKPYRRAAKAGDVAALHTRMLAERWKEDREEPCAGPAVALAPARAKRYQEMISSRWQSHAPIPTWDIDPQPAASALEDVPVFGVSDEDEDDDDAIGGADNPADFATYLTRSATWYIEFPHIDGTFVTLYASLPGYARSES